MNNNPKSNLIVLFIWTIFFSCLSVKVISSSHDLTIFISKFISLKILKVFYNGFPIIKNYSLFLNVLFFSICTFILFLFSYRTPIYHKEIGTISIFSCIFLIFVNLVLSFFNLGNLLILIVLLYFIFSISSILSIRYLESLGLLSFGNSITIKKKLNPFKKDINIFKRLPDGVEANKILTDESFSLATKDPIGYITFPQIYRHFFLLGGPGAGKTFSVLKPFIYNSIVNLMQTSFIYDFKSPELTNFAYTCWLRACEKYKNYQINFYTLNFSDPLRSHRQNPIDPQYLNNMADAIQLTAVLESNLNPSKNQEDNFWTKSGKAFISASIWFLRQKSIQYNKYYSTLGHLVYMTNSEYHQRAIYIMANDIELGPNMAMFMTNLISNNLETLSSQIASAQSSLIKLNDENLIYLTGACDFGLDINNPDDQKIICISNVGKYKEVYGPVVGLFSTSLFSVINQKNKVPSSVVFDEIPTVKLNTIDELLNTGRSNKISIMVAAQAFSQFKDSYGENKASNVRAGCGNVIYGKVMESESAKYVVDMMGKGESDKKSISISENKSYSLQSNFEEIIQASEVLTLPQGAFCGISAGGYRDKQQNDRMFISQINAKPYEDEEVPIIMVDNNNNPISQLQLKKILNDHKIKSKNEADEIVLIEYWKTFILKNQKNYSLDFSDINNQLIFDQYEKGFNADFIYDFFLQHLNYLEQTLFEVNRKDIQIGRRVDIFKNSANVMLEFFNYLQTI